MPAPREKPMSDEIRAWYKAYSEEQERRQLELRNAAVSEGISQGERKTVLRLLRLRFGSLPTGVLERIEAADGPSIERWSERLLTAQRLSDVFDEPS
jgi:hypothetical protein